MSLEVGPKLWNSANPKLKQNAKTIGHTNKTKRVNTQKNAAKYYCS